MMAKDQRICNASPRGCSRRVMKWDQPHWSGRPQLSGAPRQKLRPNAFARLARFSATYGAMTVLVAAILGLIAGGFAIARLAIDPDLRPVVSLDEQTAERQAELERQFPGIEDTFLAIVTSRDPETARQQALALAATLGQRGDLFLSAFVPGTGPFYDRNALLYRDVADVHARVGQLLQMEPLYHALAAAPDMLGFAALVSEIARAVEQGRSPPGLARLLMAVSATVEGEVKGKPRPLHWTALAGIDGEVQARLWYVLATPRPGVEREAAAAARLASNGMQGVSWVWPRRALAAQPSTLRDFVVPASLSVLLVMVLLSAGLGSVRQAAAVMLGAAVTLGCTGAAAAVMGRPLDGATWSFALAVLAPALLSGGILAAAYGQGRVRGLAPMQAVMMAAHRHGGIVTAVLLLFAAVWAAWTVRQLPSLTQFAVIVLIGCAITWIVSLTVLPAALHLGAAREAEQPPHWLDAREASDGRLSSRTGLDLVAIILLAAAVFASVFLPAMRFGENRLPALPPPLLDTPDARGAVHILAPEAEVPALVARLSTLPEVGAIRTATQFLPPDADAKIAELARLSAFTPFTAEPHAPPDDGQLRESFGELQSDLTAIADAPAAAPELREAATRLRRAMSLFIAEQVPARAAIARLETALFGDLGSVSKRVVQLAALQPPGISALDPSLLRRFVSPEGVWRVEVMPRSSTGELSFAAAMRRAVPQAAGAPVVSLVRNEMIHHEAGLAFATALVAAAVLMLAALRSIRGLVVAVAPAAAFVTLTAASAGLLEIRINAAMLAGLTTALALLIACSMLAARRFAGPGAPVTPVPLPARASLMTPVALAAAAAPLVISTRPSVAELGAVSALLMVIATLLAALLAPALVRWMAMLGQGTGRSHAPPAAGEPRQGPR